MLLFRGDLTADSGAIADIEQVAELSLDKQIYQGHLGHAARNTTSQRSETTGA